MQSPRRNSDYGFVPSYVSYTTQVHPPRGGTTHRGLGPSLSIVNQENTPKTCPEDDLMKAVSQLRLALAS